jgi:hypothetical protein
MTTRPTDVALVALATARLTRFVVSDTLGDWLIVRPLKRAAMKREDAAIDRLRDDANTHPHDLVAMTRLDNYDASNPITPAAKAVTGLDCPHCVGYWIGAGVITTYVVARRSRTALAAWRYVASTLALSYAVGHVSARID